MTTKTKGRNGGNRATPKTSDTDHYTKPSRINRKQKRGWKRGRK
ncbi:MAG: hypothetical protein Q8O37_17480 [Sulfuricellaceae bacterium]|nr:hypothetical protein [Sulfuricellaceae bacterium]